MTRQHGKFAAIAKGARQGKGGISGLDLCARSRMMLAKGHNLDGQRLRVAREVVCHYCG